MNSETLVQREYAGLPRAELFNYASRTATKLDLVVKSGVLISCFRANPAKLWNLAVAWGYRSLGQVLQSFSFSTSFSGDYNQ
jgi:hypothetical protein